jgi:hypothetical protein
MIISKHSKTEENTIGECEVCGRPMVEGASVDIHHWVPQAKGGKRGPATTIHRMCHNKIHSVWKESELAKVYNNPASIRNAPEMQEFLQWIARKPPEFYLTTKMHNRRR